jgi:hypothetical protein
MKRHKKTGVLWIASHKQWEASVVIDDERIVLGRWSSYNEALDAWYHAQCTKAETKRNASVTKTTTTCCKDAT